MKNYKITIHAIVKAENAEEVSDKISKFREETDKETAFFESSIKEWSWKK
jgi:hypothetical protein